MESVAIKAEGSVRIAALLTCHNRSELTVRCLESLAGASRHSSGRAVIETFLVDDGSTDGTASHVRTRFPSVRIIPGDGCLYWCGGMRLAWATAAACDYDAYMWLNDDVTLDDDAVEVLLAVADAGQRADGAVVVVGATRAEVDHGLGERPSYGGLDSRGVVAATSVAARIEYFNGNIVLVSRRAFQVIGGLSAAYTHGLGDIDYGIRAKRLGVPVWLAPGSLGCCAANRIARWRRRDLSLWARLRELHRPTGCPPWQLARLVWSNGGWWFPWSVLKLYLEAVFPSHMPERRTS